jgi:hypothetical protein
MVGLYLSCMHFTRTLHGLRHFFRVMLKNKSFISADHILQNICIFAYSLVSSKCQERLAFLLSIISTQIFRDNFRHRFSCSKMLKLGHNFLFTIKLTATILMLKRQCVRIYVVKFSVHISVFIISERPVFVFFQIYIFLLINLRLSAKLALNTAST